MRDVKLNGFAGSFVLLFDGFVVGDDGHGILRFFGIGSVERDLHGADALRGLGFLHGELVVVAIAAALEFFEVVAIAGDEAAHHVHVAHGAGHFGFRGFQIVFGSFDVFFRAADFAGHGSQFFLVFLLRLRELRGEFLVGGLLLLADGFGAALGLGDFRLGHADFLLGDLEVAFHVGEARIGLIELRGENFILVLLPGKILAQPGLRGIAGVAENGQSGDDHAKQNRDPARRARRFVVIGLLRTRYVWRNAHSPSSVMGATDGDGAEGKLWPARGWMSTGSGKQR